MTLRKITLDNNVRYVSKDDRSHGEQATSMSKEKEINQTRERRMLPTINFQKRINSSLKTQQE